MNPFQPLAIHFWGCMRNWCPILYSAGARRTRLKFIGDLRVTDNRPRQCGRPVVNIGAPHVVSIWLLPVLVAVTFHEAARGYAARFLGDHMASRSGGSALIRFGT